MEGDAQEEGWVSEAEEVRGGGQIFQEGLCESV